MNNEHTFSCMWYAYVCMHVCMYVSTHVQECTYTYGGLRSDASVTHSTLFSEARSLNQTQSSPIWLVSLARLFWGSHLCCLRLELQAGYRVHLVFCVGSDNSNSELHACIVSKLLLSILQPMHTPFSWEPVNSWSTFSQLFYMLMTHIVFFYIVTN